MVSLLSQTTPAAPPGCCSGLRVLSVINEQMLLRETHIKSLHWMPGSSPAVPPITTASETHCLGSHWQIGTPGVQPPTPKCFAASSNGHDCIDWLPLRGHRYLRVDGQSGLAGAVRQDGPGHAGFEEVGVFSGLSKVLHCSIVPDTDPSVISGSLL